MTNSPLGDVKRDIDHSGHFPLACTRGEGLGEVLKGKILSDIVAPCLARSRSHSNKAKVEHFRMGVNRKV